LQCKYPVAVQTTNIVTARIFLQAPWQPICCLVYCVRNDNDTGIYESAFFLIFMLFDTDNIWKLSVFLSHLFPTKSCHPFHYLHCSVIANTRE